ncbi:MAG: peptide-methionine (S)-S-oxide reductase, partial [Pseudomonadota bacterium]|nr:peptide-methionine (S)-S-oxide reductase [Pseudomonadota bacterium]
MSLLSFLTKTELPKEQDALLGRNEKIFEPMIHFVNKAQYPKDSKNLEKVYFGMGCFWGAEKYMWEIDGVFFTSVGYGDGFTKNPTYEEVCSGKTAHNEIVEVIFNPREIEFTKLLKAFW